MRNKASSNRRAFYGLNLAFWIVGCCSLAVGIYFYIEHHTYTYSAMSTAGLCVATGSTVLIISFVGCIGTSIGSKWLLYLYLAFLSLLLVVQSTTGVMGFLHDSLARERVKFSLYSTINRTLPIEVGPSKTFQVTWDYMWLKCCGVESYADWHHAISWRSNKFAPDSCCDPQYFNGSMKNCGRLRENEPRFFQSGCYEPFADWILQHLLVVKIFSVIFIVIEIALIILTILMIKELNRRQNGGKVPNYRYSNQNGDESLMAEG
ncbi:Tetraspanin [Aphelenchoides bicaudatus]|nr:Tetraspanin [Aphelenchoides bicaudatus]